LLRGKGRGRCTVNPNARIVDTPDVVHIALVGALAEVKEMHPGLVIEERIPRRMAGLDRLPKLPNAPVLVLVKELQMEVDRRTRNDAHCNPFRLVPPHEIVRVSGRYGINERTHGGLRPPDDANMVVGCEILLKSSFPFVVVAICEHRHGRGVARHGRSGAMVVVFENSAGF